MVQPNAELTEMEVEMAKSYARIPVRTCKRCGHKWVPRISSPAVCPSCHSPYWNRPLTLKKGAKRRKRR